MNILKELGLTVLGLVILPFLFIFIILPFILTAKDENDTPEQWFKRLFNIK